MWRVSAEGECGGRVRRASVEGECRVGGEGGRVRRASAEGECGGRVWRASVEGERRALECAGKTKFDEHVWDQAAEADIQL